jgi:hypothetical protein
MPGYYAKLVQNSCAIRYTIEIREKWRQKFIRKKLLDSFCARKIAGLFTRQKLLGIFSRQIVEKNFATLKFEL